jgi:hypothetical protein
MTMKMTKGVKPKSDIVLKMTKGVKAPFKRRKQYFGGVPKRSRKA